jgi:hypothetical protein
MGIGGVLPIEYEVGPESSGITGWAGLLPCTDLACLLGLLESVDRHVCVSGAQGWLDRHHVLSLLLLNLVGGSCVDDIDMLEADEGACQLMRVAERHGLGRQARSELDPRFRKGRTRSFPSATRLHEFLDAFHDDAEASKSVQGAAYIPVANAALSGLRQVNRDLVRAISSLHPSKVATLDIDATVQATTKREAHYCYQKTRAYQPLSAYWFEQDLIVHSEFRDGNVPAGHDMLRFLKEALDVLPPDVEKVRVRMDSAGYQHDVLRFCATGDRGQRAVIEFTVSCDVTEAFRQAVAEVPEADWHPIPRKPKEPAQEWAEVVFVPNATATGKHEPYRYLAVREKLRQGVLPGMDDDDGQLSLPFTPVVMADKAYRIRGIVTNMVDEGLALIRFHRQRCGKSEAAHSVMKSDLAGGILPSKRFGANAAWWAIVVLAHNLQAAMRLLVGGKKLTNKRMKAIRFALINVPALIVRHARQVYFRLARGHPSCGLLQALRRRIAALAPTLT